MCHFLRAGNSLIGFPSESLVFLPKNERMSDLLKKMSDSLIRSFLVRDLNDSLTIAQRKWAIVSKSLRSLTKIERMSESLIFLSKSLIRSFFDKKRAICS